LGFVLFFSSVPTVLTFDGLRVVIYLNDHRPEHVHVIGGGCEAVFRLGCPRGPVVLQENYGFKKSAIRRIRNVLNQNAAALCTTWEEIHGE